MAKEKQTSLRILQPSKKIPHPRVSYGVLGFCMGVRRAVDTVNLAISSNSSNKKIYTLGPLIHNPLLMNNLKNQGVEVLDSDTM